MQKFFNNSNKKQTQTISRNNWCTNKTKYSPVTIEIWRQPKYLKRHTIRKTLIKRHHEDMATKQTWSSIVLWSVSWSQVPRMIESSTWHIDLNREVVVFAGLSVRVNSATSSRSNELNAPKRTKFQSQLLNPISPKRFPAKINGNKWNSNQISW